MDEEYQRTRKYIENNLSFDVDGDLNAFETTIRVLGGLLSAYHLAGNDTLYLNKAIDLGNRLLPIFDSVRSSLHVKPKSLLSSVLSSYTYSTSRLPFSQKLAHWNSVFIYQFENWRGQVRLE